MAKFHVGTWVSPKNERYTGLVRGHQGPNTKVCWVGRQKAQPWPTNQLRSASPPRAFVLEGSLDGDIASLRSEEDLLRTWFRAMNVSLAYKNLHTLDDISVLARDLTKNKVPIFVHISCHGDHDINNRAYITLAPKSTASDFIYLNDPSTQKSFRDAFEGLSVYFSACLLGKYQDELIRFKKAAKLRYIAGFTREVSDSECMLFELLLYQGMLVAGSNFKTAITRACAAMSKIGVLGGKGKAQALVRCF